MKNKLLAVVKHLKYLKYILRHKWFVFVAGRKVGVGLWQLIIHDWHKFLPDEWFPYVEYFYGDNGKTFNGGWLWQWKEAATLKDAFDYAWNAHQNRARHHYQHWRLQNDDNSVKHLEMPEKYVREMIADWMGAGRAITGKWEVEKWFLDTYHMKEMGEDTWSSLAVIFTELEMIEASKIAWRLGVGF